MKLLLPFSHLLSEVQCRPFLDDGAAGRRKWSGGGDSRPQGRHPVPKTAEFLSERSVAGLSGPSKPSLVASLQSGGPYRDQVAGRPPRTRIQPFLYRLHLRGHLAEASPLRKALPDEAVDVIEQPVLPGGWNGAKRNVCDARNPLQQGQMAVRVCLLETRFRGHCDSPRRRLDAE